jgi:hypothetical protein
MIGMFEMHRRAARAEKPSPEPVMAEAPQAESPKAPEPPPPEPPIREGLAPAPVPRGHRPR